VVNSFLRQEARCEAKRPEISAKEQQAARSRLNPPRPTGSWNLGSPLNSGMPAGFGAREYDPEIGRWLSKERFC
jgi:hypothetical protein